MSGRRQSEAAKNKAAAAEAAETEAAEETAEDPVDVDESEEMLPDLDPNDPEPVDLEAASSGKPLNMGVPSGKRPTPNKPSFDWSKKGKGKFPNIRKDQGEEITEEKEFSGIKRVRTNQGRFIYLCTIAEYEESISALPSRELYRQHFAHAFEE